MKKLFKFSDKSSKEHFLQHVEAKKFTEISETELALADDMEKSECSEQMCSKKDLDCAMNYVFEYISYQRQYIMSEIDYLYRLWSNHQEGHLPPILGAEKLKGALDALGVGEDYDIKKRVIYASSKDSLGNLVLDLVNDRK